jgi:WD40 repeat protein
MPQHQRLVLFLVAILFSHCATVRAEPPTAKEAQHPAEPGKTDLYGDALPRGAIARLGTLRWRVFLTNFTRVSMSCDGSISALQREDFGVSVWDSATGKEVPWFKPDASIKAVLFAPDGKRLLIYKGQSNGKRRGEGEFRWTIEHREVGSGKLQKQVELESNREQLEFPQFSQDGKYFLAKRGDQWLGTVAIWDASTGKIYAKIEQEKVFFDRFTVSPDGKILAAVNEDKSLSLRELPGGRELHRLPRVGVPRDYDHYNPTFSPDGGTLVTSFVDYDKRSLYFWDVASGKLRHEIKDRGGRVAFSPDGKSLVCGETKAFRLIDTTTFKELRSFERNDDGARCLDFSADGKRLLSGHDSTIGVWDVATGKRLSGAPGHETSITSLAFAPDSRSLASGAWGETAYVWDLKTCRPRQQFLGHSITVASLAFSPDGTTLATGDGSAGFAHGDDNVDVRLWDLGKGELRRTFTTHLCGVRSLAFSKDGKSLASAGNDEYYRVWETPTGRKRFETSGHDHHSNSVAFSPDGGTLLVVGAEGQLSLWDVRAEKKLRDLGPQGKREIHFAAFVRDGKAVLTCEGGRGMDNAECRFWNVENGDLLKTIPGPRSNEWLRLVISPDGTLLADLAEDREEEGIRLWDVESGAPLVVLRGHGWVGALAFSPDGKTLASGDGTAILLWDVAQARLMGLEQEFGSTTVPAGGLRVSSERTVSFLKEWLVRVAGAEKQARPLLPKLDDDNFEIRDRAAADLEKLGLAAESVLREVLEGSIPPEERAGIERVLKALAKEQKGMADNGGRLRRVIKALEAIDSAASRKALQELAKGDAGLTVTRLAREAEERTERRR